MPPRTKTPKRRVRQPLQARARLTVEAIVEAAARILARDGWARLTTNAVAARAGVSIGTLYEYFPNKEALVEAILDRHVARGEALVSERVVALGGSTPSLERLLEALVEGFVRLHQDDPILHRRLSSEVPIPPAIEARVHALVETLVAALVQALRVDPKRPEDPELTARLVVDAVDALTHRWIVDARGPIAAPRLAEELLRMLRRYLAR